MGLHRLCHIMRRWSSVVVLLSLLGAFSRTDAGPDLTAEHPFMSRAEIRQQGAVTVRAAVLTDDERNAISARRWPTKASRPFG